MEHILKQFSLFFVTEFCYDEFFVNFNFLHVGCLRALISKALGLAIVAGSLLVKVPQIIKIFRAKSGEGISILGTSLELFAMLANVSYNYVNQYPFSAYGDGVFVLIQTTIVAALTLHYGGSSSYALAFTTLIFSALIALTTTTPLQILWSLQAANIPIVLIGKLMQAYTNYSNGSTGQLSAVTVTMLFFGTLARIFTSIQETGDLILILTYVASASANGVIFIQLIYYWNTKTKKVKQTKSKQKQKKQ